MAGKKVLSIDIGVLTTRIVEVDYKKDKPHVYNVCTFETPDGAVEDGYIRNREILSVAMKAAMTESGMRNNNVVFTMSSTKIANREVIVPLVPDNKVKGVVDANAKDYFPVDIEQYVVTYTILERMKTEKNLRLLVLAAPNQMIESYYDFAKLMNFDIVALDYVGNSSLQVLKKQTAEAGTTLSVQINEGNSLINISTKDNLLLQRTVPYGTAQVIEAVLNSGEFGVSDANEAWVKLTENTIINAKLDESGIDDAAYSYMESNDDSYAQQLRVMKAKDDVTGALSYLIKNVIRVIDYFTAKNAEAKIDKIMLCGAGSRISGLANLVRNEIFIEVDTLDNLYSIEFERAVMIDNLNKCMYMSAIGAAISPVDFIPKEHQVIAKKKNDSRYLLMGSAGIVAVGLLFALIGVGKYAIKKGSYNKKEKEAKNLEQYETLYNDYVREKSDSESVKGLYLTTLNKNSVANVMFKQLEENFPNGVVLATGMASDGEIFTLSVSSNNEDALTALIMKLRNMSMVSDVNVYSWKKEYDTDENASNGLTSMTSVIKSDIELTLDVTEEQYADIADAVASGKSFNDAVNSIYGIVGNDASDDKKDSTDIFDAEN